MNRTYLLFTLILSITFFSCNKDKRLSNKIDGRTFYIQNLQIDGNALIPYDTLHFNDCKIYKELCTGEWKRNGGRTQFYWQINEKGKEFVISNISTTENIPPNQINYDAINQCYNLSGKYEIIKVIKGQRKLTLQLKSSTTMGYIGSVVEFDLISY